jgi:hypothetical protein
MFRLAPNADQNFPAQGFPLAHNEFGPTKISISHACRRELKQWNPPKRTPASSQTMQEPHCDLPTSLSSSQKKPYLHLSLPSAAPLSGLDPGRLRRPPTPPTTAPEIPHPPLCTPPRGTTKFHPSNPSLGSGHGVAGPRLHPANSPSPAGPPPCRSTSDPAAESPRRRRRHHVTARPFSSLSPIPTSLGFSPLISLFLCRNHQIPGWRPRLHRRMDGTEWCSSTLFSPASPPTTRSCESLPVRSICKKVSRR